MSILRIVVFFVLSVFFVHIYYLQYYKWVKCFNELGRCYNPDGSGYVYTKSGIIWLFPAIIFFASSIYYLSLLVKKSLLNKNQPATIEKKDFENKLEYYSSLPMIMSQEGDF